MEQAAFSSTTGLVAGLLGPFVGWIVYFAIAKWELTIEKLCVIVTFSVGAGWATAWILSELGSVDAWGSGAITPIAAILIALATKNRTAKFHEAQKPAGRNM